jgi:hypothetical protein
VNGRGIPGVDSLSVEFHGLMELQIRLQRLSGTHRAITAFESLAARLSDRKECSLAHQRLPRTPADDRLACGWRNIPPIPFLPRSMSRAALRSDSFTFFMRPITCLCSPSDPLKISVTSRPTITERVSSSMSLIRFSDPSSEDRTHHKDRNRQGQCMLV